MIHDHAKLRDHSYQSGALAQALRHIIEYGMGGLAETMARELLAEIEAVKKEIAR